MVMCTLSHVTASFCLWTPPVSHCLARVQRVAYLYGTFGRSAHGTRAIVEAIYEPPQISNPDGTTLVSPDPKEAHVNRIAGSCYYPLHPTLPMRFSHSSSSPCSRVGPRARGHDLHGTEVGLLPVLEIDAIPCPTAEQAPDIRRTGLKIRVHCAWKSSYPLCLSCSFVTHGMCRL